MSNFKVGEVLVGIDFVYFPQYNGEECVVLEGLNISDSWCLGTQRLIENHPTYEVRWRTGEIFTVPAKNLRRKQPPAGEQSILAMFKVSPPKRIGEPA